MAELQLEGDELNRYVQIDDITWFNLSSNAQELGFTVTLIPKATFVAPPTWTGAPLNGKLKGKLPV